MPDGAWMTGPDSIGVSFVHGRDGRIEQVAAPDPGGASYL